MPQRNQLVARAAVVGIDPTAYPNDSKLEQKILYMEKNATAITGTIATTTLTSDATAVSNGDTVTIGPRTYTAKTALTETAATGTLTVSGVFSDGERVVVDGVTYTMKTTLTTGNQQQKEVLIGGSASISLDNLKTTINGTGQGTTTNLATYAHPTCTAGAKTSTTLAVSAKNVGTYGNTFTTSTNGANASWGAATLAAGAEPVANEVLIGSTADGSAFLTNIGKAINDSGTAGTNYSSNTAALKHATATTASPTTTQVINSRNFAVGNGSIATTTTATHLSFTGATMASGVAKIVAAATTNDQISNATDHI